MKAARISRRQTSEEVQGRRKGHAVISRYITSCARGRYNMFPPPCKLTFDLLTLKVVSQSRAMWATSVPILVFLGLAVLS